MTAYERALQQLSQAQPKDFVAERTRLAEELRKSDKAAAAELGKRRKPPASVWAVNQLYWTARDAFDGLLAAAAPLRKGDLRSTDAYRKALADMRRRAATALESGGLGASDATLSRIDMTLAAIAAAGGFGSDPPGALAADLAPPGFDAMGAPAKVLVRDSSHLTLVKRQAPARDAGGHAKSGDRSDPKAEAAARRREEEARERAARAEAKARAEEEARRKAKRATLERALDAARRSVERHEKAVATEEEKLRAANQELSDARQAAVKLERELSNLDR